MKLFQLLFLCLFLNISAAVSAQAYRFKSSTLSIMEKDAKGKWGKWSDFKKAEIIITLDTKKNRIIVNSQDMQLYKIVSYGEETENEFDRTVSFECVDNEEGPCNIVIITRKNQGNRMQLYINYSDLKMVYNIENFN